MSKKIGTGNERTNTWPIEVSVSRIVAELALQTVLRNR